MSYLIDRSKALEQQADRILLAMLAYGEARGEGAVGMAAVIGVALNREREWNKALRDVILQPLQFSAFNPHDPNRPKLMMADLDDPCPWGAAVAVADCALAGALGDPSCSATHYFAHSVVLPSWATPDSGWKTTALVGNHTFGRAA